MTYGSPGSDGFQGTICHWPLASSHFSFRSTRQRIPTRRIGLLLELGASDERLRKVLRILEHQRINRVGEAAIGDRYEVFREHRIFAEGHAILVDVAWTLLRGCNLQRSCGRLPALSSTATAAARVLPVGGRRALPCPWTAWGFSRAEMKETRLRPGVGFNFQRFLVLPGNVQACRHAHHTYRTVTFALLAGCLVFRRIP